MKSDIRRRWPVVLAALLLWSSANLIGSVGQAADNEPAEASDAEAQAIADQLDTMIERATARLGDRPAGEGDLGDPNADATALRARLQEAETQIRLLKNVVIQALRAQSAAEEALRREQAAAPPSVTPPEAEPAPTGSEDHDARGAGRGAHRHRPAPAGRRGRAAQPRAERGTAGTGPAIGAAALEFHRRPRTDGAIPWKKTPCSPRRAWAAATSRGTRTSRRSRRAARYAAVPADDATIAAGEPIKVAEVHFNSGSAELTPGAERTTLDALERIRSMAPAKVRVVAFTDRVGDSAYNLVLSKERALSVAAVLERTGLPRDMVEVVGSGEEGVPVPTSDGVPEPLNRSAGIFVVRDGTG